MNQKFVIEEKIKEILFNEPEKLFNIEEIHTLLSEKYSEYRELDFRKNLRKKLQFIFLKLDDKNNNIYHIIKDNKDNIIYTSRSKKDILNDFIDNFTKNDYEIVVKKETKENKYIKIIKQMVEEENYSFLFNFDLFDGENPINILILNNEFEIIKKLDNTINLNDLSFIDLTRKTKNSEMLEFFLEKNYLYRINSYENLVESLRNNIKKNNDTITILTNKTNKLEKEVRNFKLLKKICIVTLFAVALKKIL